MPHKESSVCHFSDCRPSSIREHPWWKIQIQNQEQLCWLVGGVVTSKGMQCTIDNVTVGISLAVPGHKSLNLQVERMPKTLNCTRSSSSMSYITGERN